MDLDKENRSADMYGMQSHQGSIQEAKPSNRQGHPKASQEQERVQETEE